MTRPPNTPNPETTVAGAAAAARTPDTRIGRYDWEKARGPIAAFGESKPLGAWANDPRCQVKKEALRTRLALGWDPEEAVTKPKHELPTLQFTFGEKTLTLRGWAEQSGIKYHTLYGRIHTQGLSFEEALDKGPDGEHFMVPVTAFGETKPLYRWGVDPRANASTSTIRKRIKAGWNPQIAITEEPENRSTLGTGQPYSAWGQRMSLPDWGRLSGIPQEVIRGRMHGHELTLESALHSLGWTPEASATATSLLTVQVHQLQPGDLIVSAEASSGEITVRRHHVDTHPSRRASRPMAQRPATPPPGPQPARRSAGR
ncbi:hypothetical protein [Streptomyces globisporus]|uniref:hypothetical protein n=1 Tax=Streptomyces globisporus TaxID=1908 RepID=UPI0037A6B6EB